MSTTLPKAARGLLASILVALLVPAAAAQPEPVLRVSVKASKEAVVPGDRIAIAVVFDHRDGWHIHTNDPVVPAGMEGFVPVPTTIEATAPAGLVLSGIDWPGVHHVPVGFMGDPVEYGVFEGRAVALMAATVAPNVRPGSELLLTFEIGYQACDDTSCLAPEEERHELRLAVVTLDQAAAMGGTTAHDPDFDRFDPGVFAEPVPGADDGAPSGRDLGAFGLRLPADPTRLVGVLALLGLGMLGGLLLNLTPCVLPVVPLKIMALSQAAGNPARCLFLGTMTSLGVVSFWMAIGVSIASLRLVGGTAEIFGIWWFTLGLGVFIGAMGLGMMGLFSMQLPRWVYRINPRHETAQGSFLFGVMTAVLGLPCFAPLMGGVTAIALSISPGLALGTFGAIGAGMALPYLVLAARPRWIEHLPRTGPASELIKQVMGLLLMAAGAYFVGSGLIALVAERPYLAKALHWWVGGALAAGAGAWLVVRTFQITRSPLKRGFFGVIGVGLVVLGAAPAVFFTGLQQRAYRQDAAARGQGSESAVPLDQRLWTRYTPDVFARAMDAGHVVVIDFTAEWCLNCKALKAAVLTREPVERALLSGGVVSLTADLTSRRDSGWEKLAELGEIGIPLLAIYGPGFPEPFKSNAYTVDQVLAAIGRAKGAGPARTGASPGP